MITVIYTAIDGFKKTRHYKTVQGAQRFAQKMVGRIPEMGTHYAISGDGVGKIEARGVFLHELFPAIRVPNENTMGLGYMQGRGAA